MGTPFLFTEDEAYSLVNVKNFEAVEAFPIPKGGLGKWWAAHRAYRNAGGLLFGGGGLFNEVFLRAGIPGKGIVLATARLFGVPYIIHGIEIGYVGTTFNKYITAWCLRHAFRVLCRNRSSIARAREMAGVEAELGVDLNHGWLQRRMSPPTDNGDTRRMIVNLQHSIERDDPLVRRLIADRKAEGYRIVFLANNAAEERQIVENFADEADEIVMEPTVEGTAAVLASGDTFMTERFHFTMASLHANRPTHVIVSSTKVRELVEGIANGGGRVDTVREDGAERAIVSIPGSPEQERVVAEWAERSDRQLAGAIQSLKNSDTPRRGRLHLKYLPAVAFFYGVFAFNYLRDKISPLNRYLDLSKT